MAMQLLMSGIYQKVLQEKEEMQKAVETIRKVLSEHIPLTKNGNRKVMKTAGDNEDYILWTRLTNYALLQFNRPRESTLNAGRIDLTGLKALLNRVRNRNNCSVF